MATIQTPLSNRALDVNARVSFRQSLPLKSVDDIFQRVSTRSVWGKAGGCGGVGMVEVAF